ncbi:Retrovirus-related Pol polyprotein from transposon TNT 1-94 [Dendrobium catenatum]|uniref:Retrovirus-related Pol polyprotein from transposon TNT 1-94 n=1 Tax=Dendrobium catenatum TaxID=906689 RepID=A0A2I0XC12_9ASPA|nr:Retrovirus-related Pol polyprotein from transposon TNT 1-94 [Dendrobium catenatum]
MKALLVHQVLSDAIFEENLAAVTNRAKTREIQLKAHSIILLSLGDKVLREVAEEGTTLEVWRKLESIYMKKSLTNRLLLKKQLYTLQMEETNELRKHLDNFNKLIIDLKNVDVTIDKEDKGIILLSSLSKTYENIVDTMLYGKQTLTLTEVKSILMSKDVQRKSEQKEVNSGNILIARGRSEKEGHFKKYCPNLAKLQGVEP